MQVVFVEVLLAEALQVVLERKGLGPVGGGREMGDGISELQGQAAAAAAAAAAAVATRTIKVLLAGLKMESPLANVSCWEGIK